LIAAVAVPPCAYCRAPRAVACLPRRAILSTGHAIAARQSLEVCAQSRCGQMKKAGLADLRTSNGLPSASEPETEADRTPRESLLACMNANREPSNQSFEIDREAAVCSADRRFFLHHDRAVSIEQGRPDGVPTPIVPEMACLRRSCPTMYWIYHRFVFASVITSSGVGGLGGWKDRQIGVRIFPGFPDPSVAK
jgi:hypothetical protein